MRAMPDGFELRFTLPVDPESAENVASYAMKRYTYLYHSTYGSDEIQTKQLPVKLASVSADGLSVRLVIDDCKELFVHELVAEGIRDTNGQPLLHPQAFYTLNRIPK